MILACSVAEANRAMQKSDCAFLGPCIILPRNTAVCLGDKVELGFVCPGLQSATLASARLRTHKAA